MPKFINIAHISSLGQNFLKFFSLALVYQFNEEYWYLAYQMCPECQILWKLEQISVLGPNLPDSIIVGQDLQFQALHSWLAFSIKCQIS